MKKLLLAAVLTLTCIGAVGSANPFDPFKEKTCQDWSPSSGTGLLRSELRGLADAKCMGRGLYAHSSTAPLITSRKTKLGRNYYGAIILYKTCGEQFFFCR